MNYRVKFFIKSWAGIEKISPTIREFEAVVSEGYKRGEKEFGSFLGAAFIVSKPSLKVENIYETGIEIVTNGLVERNPNGTISLMKDNNNLHFKISAGEKLELVTQSTDSGFSVTILPIKKVDK